MFDLDEYIGERFSDLELSGKSWTGKKFRKCSFHNLNMDELDTTRCEFADCKFVSCRMNGAVHSHSTFTNCIFKFHSFFCVEFDNCKMVGSSFVEASTIGLLIRRGNWSYTDVRNTDFSKQTLDSINFEGADLRDCNFEKATVTDCNFSSALMTHCNLKNADIRGSRLDGVDVLEVSFKSTKIDLEQAAVFARALGAEVTF